MPTYYISPSGDDTRTSAQAQNIDTPWRTLGYALTGSRIPVGSEVVLLDGVYNEYYSTNVTIACVLAAGSGVTVVRAGNIFGATISIPAATTTQFFTGPDSSAIRFYGLNFTNTHSISKPFFAVSGRRDIELDRCVIDNNNSTYYPIRLLESSLDEKLTIKRTVIKNTGSIAAIRNDKASGNAPVCVLAANVIYDSHSLLDSPQKINLAAKNNTSYRLSSRHLSFNGVGNILDIKNNIFVATPNSNGYTASVCAMYFGDKAALDVLANPESYDISNNVLHNGATTFPEYEGLVKTDNTVTAVIPMDSTNRYIDPCFADVANKDFSLSATGQCYVSGRGDASVLPETDINGNAWTGADVGAFKNPSATISYPPLNTNLVSFCGDSIMNGAWGQCWQQFAAITGVQTVANGESAVGGMRIEGIRWIADNVIFKFAPHVMFLAGGINNMHLPGHNITNAELVAEITSTMERIESAGIAPMWLGIASMKNFEDQDRPGVVNDLVDAVCEINGWAHDSIFAKFKLNQNWKLPSSSNGYYDDLDNDLHPNVLGHYVIAELARNLYYGTTYEYADVALFDSTLPALSLAPTAPGKLKSVQEWSKVASAKEIGKY